LALSQTPEHDEGEEQKKLDPQVFTTHVLALAKPPSMSRGRVDDMSEEKVGATPKNLIIVFNKILLSNKYLFKDF
jgi:hypothetical protein